MECWYTSRMSEDTKRHSISERQSRPRGGPTCPHNVARTYNCLSLAQPPSCRVSFITQSDFLLLHNHGCCESIPFFREYIVSLGCCADNDGGRCGGYRSKHSCSLDVSGVLSYI